MPSAATPADVKRAIRGASILKDGRAVYCGVDPISPPGRLCPVYRHTPEGPECAAKAWPYCHIDDTYNHMKTTLNIDDTVMAELKREAARQGRTMSELVETALRLLLRSQRKREKIVALPSFRSGGALVDIADRDALYQAMEGR